MEKPVLTVMEQLSRAIDRQDISYLELAKQSGISRQHIWAILNGEHNPSVTLLKQLAGVLELDLVLMPRDNAFIYPVRGEFCLVGTRLADVTVAKKALEQAMRQHGVMPVCWHQAPDVPIGELWNFEETDTGIDVTLLVNEQTALALNAGEPVSKDTVLELGTIDFHHEVTHYNVSPEGTFALQVKLEHAMLYRGQTAV
jgi:transcriptional regulator with XRE-family HTH domain